MSQNSSAKLGFALPRTSSRRCWISHRCHWPHRDLGTPPTRSASTHAAAEAAARGRLTLGILLHGANPCVSVHSGDLGSSLALRSAPTDYTSRRTITVAGRGRRRRRSARRRRRRWWSHRSVAGHLQPDPVPLFVAGEQPGEVAGIGPVDLGLLVLGEWVGADRGNAPPAVEYRIHRCEVEPPAWWSWPPQSAHVAAPVSVCFHGRVWIGRDGAAIVLRGCPGGYDGRSPGIGAAHEDGDYRDSSAAVRPE